MGGNLPWWFKGIDDFTEGVATSFKTIDLDSVTYQHAPNLASTITRYVNKLAVFNGKSYTNWEVESGKITSRALKLIVPKGSMIPAQKAVIDAATQRAQSRGITLSVTPF
jgi:filamentous hemagglutinin